jgi:tRNA 5-methylaminomethyl-2-thiouridine biosynthesis bifunctional protein
MTWGKLKQPQILWTETGVPSSAQYGDVYYNNENSLSGIDESRVVFLEGIGAPNIWQNKQVFTIVETGFGTGLNFFNTWLLWQKTAEKNARLNFISIENSPLNIEQISKALEAFEIFKPLVEPCLKQYPPKQAGFHNILLDDEKVRLTLMFGDIEDVLPKLIGGVDAWFLDGFAPNKNPRMWSDSLFKEISNYSNHGAKLATFTAAGFVRRALEDEGFKVEKKSGFGKKRERITASLNAVKTKIKPTKTPQSIAIIGAGVAGCMLAHKLKKRGLDVTLIDKHAKPAQETSANPAALISPKLALGSDPYDRLLSHSYLEAIRYYHNLSDIWLSPKGLLSMAKDPEKKQYFEQISEHFKNNLGWDGIFENLSNEEIMSKWQLKCNFGGLYFPDAGSIDTTSLIKQLCLDINYIQAEANEIKPSDNGWLALSNDGATIVQVDAIVLACGLNSYGVLNREPSPLTPNRGQISIIDDEMGENMPSLSFAHYLTAPFYLDGKMKRIIGASHSRIDAKQVSQDGWKSFVATDEQTQLTALSELTERKHSSTGYKVGLRATTIDHMPIVGALGCVTALETLPKNRQKILPNELDESHRQTGLFILAGLGARGYQLAPILTEVLLSQILNQPLPLDSDIIYALDPTRFALRRRRHEKL